jgi:hypothetical protein
MNTDSKEFTAAAEAVPFPGWERNEDEDGNVYYVNEATGASQWEAPTV